MWGPYNRSWRKLKDATRPTRFYGDRGPATDIGPVTLHARGRRHRDEKGFEKVAGWYVATIMVAAILGLPTKLIGEPFITLFLIVVPSVACAAAIQVLTAYRLRWPGFLFAAPLLAAALGFGAIAVAVLFG